LELEKGPRLSVKGGRVPRPGGKGYLLTLGRSLSRCVLQPFREESRVR